jgi:hypothetical protein
VRADAGRPEAARAAWRQALVLFERVGAPEAEAVAEALGQGPPA